MSFSSHNSNKRFSIPFVSLRPNLPIEVNHYDYVVFVVCQLSFPNFFSHNASAIFCRISFVFSSVYSDVFTILLLNSLVKLQHKTITSQRRMYVLVLMREERKRKRKRECKKERREVDGNCWIFLLIFYRTAKLVKLVCQIPTKKSVIFTPLKSIKAKEALK